VIGNQIEAWLIENGRRMNLSNGKANCITEALA
jgi:hypothetical protein